MIINFYTHFFVSLFNFYVFFCPSSSLFIAILQVGCVGKLQMNCFCFFGSVKLSDSEFKVRAWKNHFQANG